MLEFCHCCTCLSTMPIAALVFSANEAGPKNFENISGRQFTRDSWKVAYLQSFERSINHRHVYTKQAASNTYGRMNASFFDSGRFLENLAALLAMSAKARLSSNIEAPVTVTEGGRKCLSHSGM